MERDPQRYHGDLFSKLTDPDLAREAWGNLYSIYWWPLADFLTNKYIRHDREAVEDIVEDAFLALWDSKDKVVTLNIAKDWLFKAARFRAISFCLARQLGRSENLEDYMDHPDDYRADLAMDDAEERELIEQVISGLPEREQAVIRKKFFEGIGNKEIAEGLGVSPQTVSNQAKDGLNRMKKDVNLLDWMDRKADPDGDTGKKKRTR